MRLPRGYTVTGATYADPDRPELAKTRWRAHCAHRTGLGSQLLGDCWTPEEAVSSAWGHALERWEQLASTHGMACKRGYDPDLRVELFGAHALLWGTGKVSFGGKPGARKRLAQFLRDRGLLRGCDHKAHGGEWDLPRFGGAPCA